jgi:hypothetical protein
MTRRRRSSTSKAKKACRLHPDSNIVCTQAAKKHTNFETSCNFSTPTTSMTRTKEEAKKPCPVEKKSRKAGDGN